MGSLATVAVARRLRHSVAWLSVCLCLIAGDFGSARAEQADELRRIEAAMAADGAVSLLHLDARRIVDLERVILGPEDPQALMAKWEREQPLLTALRGAGVEPREAIDDLIVGIHVKEGGPTLAGAMLGRFPVDRLRQALSQTYESRSDTVAGREIMVVVPQDRRSCEAQAPIMLHMTPERLLFASDSDGLAALMEGRADVAEDQEFLEGWRSYRRQRVLSFALFAPPADLAARVDDPTARFAAKQAGDDIEPVTGLFAGVSLQVDPVALVLDAEIETNDAEWPRQQLSAYEAWRARVQREMADRLPSLTALQQYLEVEASGTSLLANARIDEAMTQDLARLPAELLAAMFSGMGGAFDQAIPKTGKRTLEANQLPRFEGTTSHAEIPPYDPRIVQTFHAQSESGPFAFRLEAVRLNDKGQTELQVSTTSGPIPNLGTDTMHRSEDRPRAALTITGVYDAEGNNLMPMESCGKELNQEAAALDSSKKTHFVDGEFETFSGLDGRKVVRLAPEARLGDIARVEGYVSLRLPIEVEAVRVERPFAGAVLEAPELRLAFLESENGVKYEASGEIDRMLAMLAIDEDGQYLASGSSFSSGRFMGSGKAVGRSFAGEPEALEVVVAVEEETKSYDFTLEPARVRFNVWDHPEAFAVETASGRGLDAGDWQPDEICKQEPASPAVTGPVAICVAQLRPGWSGTVSAQVRVVTPYSAALRRNLSGVEFRVARIGLPEETLELEMPAGEFLELDKPQFGADAAASLDNGFGEYLGLDTGKDTLGSATISSLGGEVVLRLPTEIAALPLELDRLGREIEGEGFKARFTGLADGAVLLEISGPRERFVQFRPYDDEGRLLATNAESFRWDEEASLWRARFRSSGQPARVDLVVALAQEISRHAFDVDAAE